MTDQIALKGLAVPGRHGVFEFEKQDGQVFLVDITVRLDLTEAARTDDLTHTVHYGELAQLAARIIAGPARDLIETVAAEIADAVLRRFPVDSVEVTLHKPAAPIPLEFDDVAVTIRRSTGRTATPAGPGSS